MDRESPAAVWEWARANGYEVRDGGRVPARLQRAFDEARAEQAGPPLPDEPVPSGLWPSAPSSDPWTAAPSSWPPPYYDREGRDGFAIAALVFGIFPAFAGLLGVVFGWVALVRIRRSGRKGRRMAITGLVLGALWLVGVSIALGIGAFIGPDRDGSGAATTSGDVFVEDLLVEDCIAKVPDHATRTVRVIPCNEPHGATVYAIFRLEGSTYPGDAAVTRFAEGGCDRRLTSRAGSKPSDEYLYYSPSRTTWALGDHDVVCIVVPSEAPTAAETQPASET